MRLTIRGCLRSLAAVSTTIIATLIVLGALLSPAERDLVKIKARSMSSVVERVTGRQSQDILANQAVHLKLFENHSLELATWFERFGFDWQQQLLLSSAELIKQCSPALLATSFIPLLNTIFLALVTGPFAVLGFLIVVGNPFRLWEGSRGARDILGLCGSGRAFFSGARARIPRELSRSDYSAPIPSLITAPRVNPPTFWSSKLSAELESTGSLNKTTMELGRIILAGAALPAFIIAEEEQEIFNRRVKAVSIEEYTLRVLRAIANTFARFNSNEMRIKEVESPFKIEAAEHMALLSSALVRVLDLESVNSLKHERGQLLAITLVLARIAGLVHSTDLYSENRYFCSSMYPELTARALLQSIPSFVKEYSSLEQSDLRRALNLTTRVSPVGATKFPIGISARCFALRQWSELIGENPLRLTFLADDLELHALLNQARLRFEKVLLGKIRSRDVNLFDAAVVTGANNLLVKVPALTQMFREVFPEATIRRTEELLTVVNLKRRIRAKQSSQEINHAELGLDGGGNITLPLSLSEIRQIAKEHGIEPRDLKDWSILKGILGMHGWLARRVGDVPVPKTAVVFVISGEAGEREFDEGFVALRDDRLRETFGESWGERFRVDPSVVIVSSRDRVERALVDEDRLGVDLFNQEDDVGEGG